MIRGTAHEVPVLARLAALGAALTALELPLRDGAADPFGFLLASSVVAATLFLPIAPGFGTQRQDSWVRTALIVAGTLVIFAFGPSPGDLFPEGAPLSSRPVLSMLWLLLLSAAFLHLPDGPLVFFCLSGTILVLCSYVDYGTVGVPSVLVLVFACVSYELVSVPGEGRGGRENDPWAVLELSVALTAATVALGLVLFIFAPWVLPELELDGMVRRLEDRLTSRAPAGQRGPPAIPAAPGERQGVFGTHLDPELDAAWGEPPSPAVLFRVRGEMAHHLRLRAYREFDGRRWRADPRAVQRQVGSLHPRTPLELFRPALGQAVALALVVEEWNGTTIPANYAAARVRGPALLLSVGEDWSLQASRPLARGEVFEIESYPGVSSKEETSRSPPEVYLEVPSAVGPRVRAMAERISERDPSPVNRAEMTMELIGRTCRYSWRFGSRASLDVVDHFLFEEQAGNCTSFASALAVLLRLQGIPARFVAGFIGGTEAEEGVHVVTSRHAHAWVEAWLGDGRWTPLDAVPPGVDPAREAAVQAGEEADPPPVVSAAGQEASAMSGEPARELPPPVPVPRLEPPAPEPAGPSNPSLSSGAAAKDPVRRPPSLEELRSGGGTLGPLTGTSSERYLARVRWRARAAARGAAEQVRRRWGIVAVLAGLAGLAALVGRRRLRVLRARLMQLVGIEDAGLIAGEREQDFLDRLASRGLVRHPWETLLEFLSRLEDVGKAPSPLRPLIELAVRFRYASRPPSQEESRNAGLLLSELYSELDRLPPAR